MTDTYETPDTKLIWPLRAIRPSGVQQPGTLSPDPWHFALWASSMIQEQGVAAVMPPSPMPLDCCPPATRAHARGRGACQQSPTLHSSNVRLSRMSAVCKGH